MFKCLEGQFLIVVFVVVNEVWSVNLAASVGDVACAEIAETIISVWRASVHTKCMPWLPVQRT